MQEFYSLLVLLEILFFTLSLYVVFVARYSKGESLCYAIITAMVIYSLLIQLFFIIKVAKYSYVIDILIISYTLVNIFSKNDIIIDLLRNVVNIVDQYRFLYLFLLFYIYLFLQAILLPPSNYDSMSYNLARVLMMKRENSLFLQNYSYFPQINFVVGYDILSYLFLRFNSDFSLGIFSYLSYIAIIIGTYALVNKIINNKKLAIYTALIISTLTEIVLQATSTKNDIPAAAIAVACFLAGHNILYLKDKYSLLILGMLILFGLSVKNYFMAFACPFLLLQFIIFIYHHSLKDFILLFKIDKEGIGIILIILSLITTLTIFFGKNYINFGGISGDKNIMMEYRNKDGLKGASINMARYFIQTLELPDFIFAGPLKRMHDKILRNKPKIGMLDYANIELTSKWIPEEDASWYGPLAFFLIIPSVFYTIIKGKNYIKIIAINLLVFFLIICYILPWLPWNNRFFSIFFAGSGVCLALLLRNLKIKYMNIILGVSFLFLAYSACLNSLKPIIDMNLFKYKAASFINRNLYTSSFLSTKLEKYKEISININNRSTDEYPIFYWIDYIINRDKYSDQFFGADLVSQYARKLDKNQSVLLLTHIGRIFPFLLRRPDLNIVVTSPDRLEFGGKNYNLTKKSDFNEIKNHFRYILLLEVPEFKYISSNPPIIRYRGHGMFVGDFLVYNINDIKLK